MKKPVVPVIMYHSLGPRDTSRRVLDLLRIPTKLFESHLRHLKKKGFTTISLMDLYEYISFNVKLPSKPIVLTFDDGYLDNWVYAYPLLKKYGFQGTIFVSTDFIDPTKLYRSNLEDVYNGKISKNKLKDKGFLSYREMKEMEDQGVMDIQGHGKTHTFYPINDEIIEFHYRGGIKKNAYEFMIFNENKECKYKYLTEDIEPYLRYGTPIYKMAPAIGNKRYFPDENMHKFICDRIEKYGINNFFNKDNWRLKAYGFVKAYKKSNELDDRYETDDEYKKRVKDELYYSKKELERNLGKKINFLCWPNGGLSEYSFKKAFDYGYLAVTKPSMRSFSNKKRIHYDGVIIERIGATSHRIADNQHIFGIGYTGGIPLLLKIKNYNCKSKNYFTKGLFEIINVYFKVKFYHNMPYNLRFIARDRKYE